MISKEHILSEIRRTTEENGGSPLGVRRFKKETGIKQSDWKGKTWIKWSDAIKEAGYIPNIKTPSYEDDFLIQKLIELVRELGHFPTRPELGLKAYRDKDFPSDNTFYRHFKKSGGLTQAILRYSEEHIVDEKVVKICKAAATKSKPKKLKETESEQEEFGFVYLMKSGKHFKIGRSKCAERREFELKILLPEKLELIHKIKTDDPVGIENYWHERFKEKRKGGEWFELSSNDVKAFKRRKFM